jgi:hypothetical protein
MQRKYSDNFCFSLPIGRGRPDVAGWTIGGSSGSTGFGPLAFFAAACEPGLRFRPFGQARGLP